MFKAPYPLISQKYKIYAATQIYNLTVRTKPTQSQQQTK